METTKWDEKRKRLSSALCVSSSSSVWNLKKDPMFVLTPSCLFFDKQNRFCGGCILFSYFLTESLKTIKIQLWCHSQEGLPRYMEHSNSSLLNDQSPLALIFGWTKVKLAQESRITKNLFSSSLAHQHIYQTSKPPWHS